MPAGVVVAPFGEGIEEERVTALSQARALLGYATAACFGFPLDATKSKTDSVFSTRTLRTREPTSRDCSSNNACVRACDVVSFTPRPCATTTAVR